LRNIKIIFSYDGERFFGSQAQTDKDTVQGSLEEAISQLTGEKIRVTLAGRTDRGVHALAQAANFKTGSLIPERNFAAALNSRVSGGIQVISSEDVPPGFDARRDAKTREYTYLVYNGDDFPVMFWDRALNIKEKLDIKSMEEAAKVLMGRHDFRNFCSTGSSQNHYVRHVYEMEIRAIRPEFGSGRIILIRIKANSFLYKMVRFIVGVLIEIGSGRKPISFMKERMSGKASKEKARVVAPCGLYLSEVKY
jgi:tRNA pseudouridine38-40 synthase